MTLRIGFDMDGVLADFSAAYHDVEDRLALHARDVEALEFAFVRAAPDVHFEWGGSCRSHPDHSGSGRYPESGHE